MASSAPPHSSPAPCPHLARPGVLAFLGLAVGQVWVAALEWQAWQPLAAAALLVLALALCRGRFDRWLAILIAAGFCAVGAAQQAALQHREALGSAPIEQIAAAGAPLVEVHGELATLPTRRRTGFEAELRPGALLGWQGQTGPIPAPILVRVSFQDQDAAAQMAQLVPGERVRLWGKLQPLSTARFGLADADWRSGRGYVALLTADVAEPIFPGAERNLWQRTLAFMQGTGHAAEAAILRTLPPREGALLSSMTLGRTYHLQPDQRDAFRRAGLLHLFAVSGLHTMIIGGIAAWLLRLTGLRAGPRLLALAVILVLFAALQGLRPSVVRAAALLLLYEGCDLLRRPVEPLGGLGTVAAVFVLFSPRLLWQADFQMTFLCVTALAVAAPWLIELRKFLGRRLGWGWRVEAAIRGTQILGGSLAIQLALAPVLAAHFGEVSMVAPISNLVLLPLATLLIQAGAGFLLLAALVPPAGLALLEVLEFPLAFMDWMAHGLGGVSWAAFATAAFPLIAVLFFYIVLVGASWNVMVPGTAPRRLGWSFVPGFLALLLPLAWGPVLAPAPEGLRVTFLDVGQGDAILIQTPEGSTALIDAGPPQAAFLLPSQLRELGVDDLQLLVATHADADHIGGLAEVLEAFPAEQLLVGGSLAATREFEEAARVVLLRDIPVATVRRGALVTLGPSVSLRVLHPTDPFLEEGDTRNDASIVLMLEYAGRRILLTGDAEEEAEADLLAADLELEADVLKAAHHGARSSTGADFLRAVRPEYTVISCGRLNRYGHPHPDVLGRLGEVQSSVYRTDEQGTLELRISRAGHLRWRTAR